MPSKRDQIAAFRGKLLLSTLYLYRNPLKWAGAKNLYCKILNHFLKQTSLFDEDFYRSNNPDVDQSRYSPLEHYIKFGDRESRQPNPVFDPNYYRAHCRGKLKSVNTLLHYLFVGRFLRISPSPWFNTEFYLAHNKDVARSGSDPLEHYLQWGGSEGRSPCMEFDGSFYLRSNRDVQESGINPLLHYLTYGRKEGRMTMLGGGNQSDEIEEIYQEMPIPIVPTDDEWDAVVPRKSVQSAIIDVIVPVYKGKEETLQCIYSALASPNEVSHELVVIDDCSPDKELSAELKRLSDKGLFTLLVNVQNLGFVSTVNRGMRLHDDRDVVLLNADTEVYNHWLDRMHAATIRHPKTGTVTPLSNNATVCSYPRFLHDNPFPLEISYAELDLLAAKCNEGFECEAPTAVGFCMYIRRKCLKEVGLFDDETFGKGYGEENDFCQRAIKKHWRNVIIGDVFVRHWGSTSFQGEKGKRVQNAMRIINKMYPQYDQDVQQFITTDPLASARKNLDVARLTQHSQTQNALIIVHNRGGGSERHVQEDIQRLTQEGMGVYTLRPKSGRPSHGILRHPKVPNIPNIGPVEVKDIQTLIDVLKPLNITEIHTHGLVDFEPSAPNNIVDLVNSLGAKLEINLHDYKVICPQINLADADGYYCGEPSVSNCNQCIQKRGSPFGIVDIQSWRSMHEKILARADQVLVPNGDMSNRMGHYYSDISYVVSPHEDINISDYSGHLPSLQAGERLRVVIIGAISKIKGYNVLLACARNAKKRKLPIDFIVVGYTMNDEPLLDAGVKITGKYNEDDAQTILAEQNAHLSWFTSIWPETYSYTLSIAIEANLPIVAFDIGAIARRLEELNSDHGLIQLNLAKNPELINDFFLEQCAHFNQKKIG